MNVARQRRPSLVVSLALVVAALAIAAPGWLVPRGESTAKLKANVKVVKVTFTVTNEQTASQVAKCPGGTKVFSGAYASTGVHARVFVAGPSRGENGYVVHAYGPPVNINAGVGEETATITVVAYCAPVGQPIVLG